MKDIKTEEDELINYNQDNTYHYSYAYLTKDLYLKPYYENYDTKTYDN